LGYSCSTAPDIPTALETVLDDAGANDLICITGSIFTVADAREIYFRRNNLPLPPIDPEI
jgi:folylpolyglutamate synthase/dihydropteroate synthase